MPVIPTPAAIAVPGARAVVIHAPHDLRVETREGEVADVPAGNVRVRVGVGGICGSDLHYFHRGGFGTVRIEAPMILGHEVAGTVEAVGAGVEDLEPGDTVAINPSRPCRACPACRAGRANLCPEVRFLGSAMRWPHVEGAFVDLVDCPAENVVPLPDGTALTEAALSEPFAVALHAVARAGDLTGATVMIAGAGPIGLLIAVAARRAGATHVTVSDLFAAPLERAVAIGVDRVVNVAEEEGALRGAGVDVAFDASGAAPGILDCLAALRPGGRLVLVGQGATVEMPVSSLVTREMEIVSSFRFDTEFRTAAELIGSQAVDLRPLLTHLVPVADAVEAFGLASDRTRSMKVQLSFA